MRTLFIDIETSPNLAYVWSLWDQNIGLHQLVESGEVICWGAKWLGEEEIIFRSIQNGKRHMIRRAWKLLDEADVVIHFNGKRFDIPWLNREFLEAGYKPPSPYKQVDLMTVCKQQFKFPSNKLEYITKRLGMLGKVKHEGFDLWLKCMAKDADAWEKMREYNIRDVIELEELYITLKPWIKNHPSWGAFTGIKNICPKCASENLKPRGYAYTTQTRYKRLVCGDCGAWTRSTTNGETTNILAL